MWALVAFGSYSLACIGYNLFFFYDCPEASVELTEEIKGVRAELQTKGFKFTQ
jgi:hypothetical protein